MAESLVTNDVTDFPQCTLFLLSCTCMPHHCPRMKTEGEPDFNSCELGTKDYWDKTYLKELQNFDEHGDVGHIWYGKRCHMRVMDWMKTDVNICHEDHILDLGCGNGLLLIELRKLGYTCLCGLDYSPGAIALANEVAASYGITDIKFETVDLLAAKVSEGSCLSPGKYKMCHDKGTYDSISSMPDESYSARKKYREIVRDILQEDGLLVITSCNWTRDQLISHFSCDFQLYVEIPSPKLQFGGETGSTVTILVFKRNKYNITV